MASTANPLQSIKHSTAIIHDLKTELKRDPETSRQELMKIIFYFRLLIEVCSSANYFGTVHTKEGSFETMYFTLDFLGRFKCVTIADDKFYMREVCTVISNTIFPFNSREKLLNCRRYSN